MYLLDTNVLSELRKRDGNPHVKAWVRNQPSEVQFISVVTVMEIEIGILRKARVDPTQGAVLRTWLEQQVLPGFADRILSIDLATARRVADLHVPDPAPERDALIAATALARDLAVATRNTTDFVRTGVAVVNPWEVD